MGFFRQRDTASMDQQTRFNTVTVRIKSASSSKYSHTAAVKAHAEWETLYATTIAGSLIDMWISSIFGAGYTLQGDDNDLISEIDERIRVTGLRNALRGTVRNSMVHGYGIMEKVSTATGGMRYIPISSVDMVPQVDTSGNVLGFDQILDNGRPKRTLDVTQCIYIVTIPSEVDIGISLIARNQRIIEYYDRISKATAELIWQKGFPIWDIELGGADLVPSDVPSRVESVVPDLAPGSNLTTSLGTKISELNSGGIPNVQSYADWSLQQLAIGFMLPRSMLGMIDNSEATAKVTRTTFYSLVQAIQDIVAEVVQDEIIDPVFLPSVGARPGTVKFVFNNPDPDSLFKKLEIVDKAMKLDPMDPYSIFGAAELAAMCGKKATDGEYDKEDRK